MNTVNLDILFTHIVFVILLWFSKCSMIVRFANHVFGSWMNQCSWTNQLNKWITQWLSHKESLVATYLHNHLTCKKSHWKIPINNSQTDSLSGKNTDKWSVTNSKKSQCCLSVFTVFQTRVCEWCGVEAVQSFPAPYYQSQSVCVFFHSMIAIKEWSFSY